MQSYDAEIPIQLAPSPPPRPAAPDLCLNRNRCSDAKFFKTKPGPKTHHKSFKLPSDCLLNMIKEKMQG